MVEEVSVELPLDQLDYDFLQKNIGKNSFEMSTMASSQPSSLPLLDVDDEIQTMLFNYDDDATMQLQNTFKVEPNYHYPKLFPPSQPSNICNTDYAGPRSFEVFMDSDGLKNPWEYSAKCNKIYIDMKHKFPINFSVNCYEDEPLFVRAMPMYEEHRYSQELVHRCICHEQPQDPMNAGIPPHVVQHIMRCDNKEAQYFGDREQQQRLSLIIPLSRPQPGTDSVKEYFQFVCKSSCVGGMNRRPIQIIFTLEKQCGTILGRRVLCVRICSCPKRDREKDELKKDKHTPIAGKKRKIEKKIVPATETVDTKPFPLNISIVGEENYKDVLNYCYNLMAGNIVKLEDRNVNAEPFRQCLNEINVLRNK